MPPWFDCIAEGITTITAALTGPLWKLLSAKESCWVSQVAQWSRIHLPLQEDRFDPWVRKIPWRRKWQPIQITLPGKLHGEWNLAGYNPWGLQLLLLLLSHFSRVQLCDPINGSPPGSPVPGILQARTLEWIAISLSWIQMSNWAWAWAKGTVSPKGETLISI